MENVQLSRTKMHEQAMLVIFQYLFYEYYVTMDLRKDIEEIICDITDCPFDECDDFFKAIVFETIKNENAYVNIISEKLNKWSFARLPHEDKAILLLFTSELMNNRAPKQVIIDMAIDLAHKYCLPDQYRYINKVLDRIGKENA